MDTTQLLLTVVLTITTILLVIVGVQLIFVLRDLRITIRKINGIIEAFEKIGGSVEHGFGEVFGFLSGIKTLFKVVDIVHNKKNAKSK
ncbi:MAG: hypothetical protein Q7R95_02650 [bacterium]|nr:hypothetical protein [bacterium]